MAAVVSAKIICGSRPETNVSEQRILAMKPVATRGRSRARIAVSASAPLSAAVARRMIRFLGGTAFSGKLHHRGMPDMASSRSQKLAGFGNRPDRKPNDLADFEITQPAQYVIA